MSPRQNRRRRDDRERAFDEERARHGAQYLHDEIDGAWTVRHLSGDSGKTYRCPGCVQEIRPGVPHVVAWPTDGWGDVGDRRHWHTTCWRARDRRGPATERSRNAPRYG